MDPGDEVEVRSRLDGTWAPGFEVAGIVRDDGGEWRYYVRRVSDSTVLPETFGTGDVRRQPPG